MIYHLDTHCEPRISLWNEIAKKNRISLLVNSVLNNKSSLNTQDVLRIESKYSPEIKHIIDILWDLWNREDYKQDTLGHDIIHISYDILEFLYAFHSLDAKDRLISCLWWICHDLWRLDEIIWQWRTQWIDFKNLKWVQIHALYSALQVLQIWKTNLKSMVSKNSYDNETIKQILKKISYTALYHSGWNSDDANTHNVQTFDRLAWILWSREFVRNIVCDLAQRGARIFPDTRLDFSKELPGFNNLPPQNFASWESVKSSWTNVFHYIEMPMRNLFSLSNDISTSRANAMRRESGIILTLLAWWKNTDFFKQTFAPELDRYESGNISSMFIFPKTLLPKEIWDSISYWVNQEEKQIMDRYSSKDIKELIDICFFQQAPFISEKDSKKIKDLIESELSIGTTKNFKEALLYVIAAQEIRRKEEIEFLQSFSSNPEIPDIYRYLALKLLGTTLFDK